MRGEVQCRRGAHTPRKKKQQPESKWMSVLTDLLLSLLSQPSQLWRTVVEQVGGTGGGASRREGFHTALSVFRLSGC